MRSGTLDLASARTLLFVPGHRPEMFERALLSDADAMILDLEDAVAESAKDSARASVTDWLQRRGAAIVRINEASSLREADVNSIGQCSGLLAVMVPKATPSLLESVESHLPAHVPLLALIESAQGLAEVRAIAARPRVLRLAFGSLDMAADLECEHSRESLLLARSEMVLASRLAGIPAPLDGVTTALRDLEAVDSDARYAKQMGFGGKMCVHPAQVDPVNSVFSPSAEEISWAVSVLASAHGGAENVSGELVDGPVRVRARRVLSLVGRETGGDVQDE